MKKVVANTSPIKFYLIQYFKLLSVDLVHLQGNDDISRCDLYREDFCKRIKVTDEHSTKLSL